MVDPTRKRLESLPKDYMRAYVGIDVRIRQQYAAEVAELLSHIKGGLTSQNHRRR